MKKMIVCGLAGLTLSAATPAVAQAGPYLSASDAARTAGRILHDKWNVVSGSGRFSCPRVAGRPDYRVCYTSYLARGGGCWWTDIGIRKLWSGNYRYRILFDTRCH